MQKIKIIAIEDESDLLQFLKTCLQSLEEVELLGATDNTKEAYQMILKLQPDAVFADIEIVGGNIISEVFLKLKLNGIKLPYLVITSGFPHYASKLINEYSEFVIRFIEKPFVDEWEEKFQEAIWAIKQKLSFKNNQISNSENQNHHFIKSGENYIKLRYKDILWLEVAGNGGSYYVTDQDNYLVDVTLNKLLEQLPKPNFMRISRDIIINLDHLKRVNKEDRTAILIKQGKNKELSIGDSYYSDLLKRMRS